MNVHQTATQQALHIAIGDYPHTAALKNNTIKSDRVALDFADIKPVYKAFAEMVRKTAYDVSEMAIVTYLQAKSHCKPLVLLPSSVDADPVQSTDDPADGEKPVDGAAAATKAAPARRAVIDLISRRRGGRTR